MNVPSQTRTNSGNVGIGRWAGEGRPFILPRQGDLLALPNRRAEHSPDHVQLLLEANHSQARGGHAGIQAGEPDVHQEAVTPRARAGLSTETSATATPSPHTH